jgi:hypothetical protein
VVDAAYYTELLRPVFEGRKVIVAMDVLQGAGSSVPFLSDVGAQRPFLLAGVVGTGPVPTAEEAEQHVLNVFGDGTMMGGIRVFENALADLPVDALAALDAYDPDREAIVLGGLFSRDGTVASRRVYGGRPASWEALEDKTAIDDVLARAGIDLAPSRVVRVTEARAVAGEFDRGAGTAWAGDARDGWWGGAAFLRWVRDDGDARGAETFLARSSDRVRLMPFLEGIPCSIHGTVFADMVIAFRPIEMLTLRRKDENQLLYCGVASYWDPAEADREAMRDIARRIGATLREQVGYRGMFTLDGVLTADGFLPTELNPRPGAGLTPMMAASGADATRGGGPFTLFSEERTETELVPIAKRDGRYVRLREDEQGDGVLALGPAVTGSLVRYVPDATRVPSGPSFAPTATEIFAFTDAEFGTGLGPLEPARSVR